MCYDLARFHSQTSFPMSTQETARFLWRFSSLARCPGIAAIAAAILTVAALSFAAEARSSGGYSRPSLSAGSRSTSFSPSHYGGGTGGYVRPRLSSPSEHRTMLPPSAGDRAVSRRSAQDALEQFRARNRPAIPEWDRPRRPTLAAPPARDGYTGYTRRPSFEPVYHPPATYDWAGAHPPLFGRPRAPITAGI